MDINTSMAPSTAPVVDVASMRGGPQRSLVSTVASAPPVAPAVSSSGGSSPVATVPPADLKRAIEAGSKALQGFNQTLEFQIDEKSKESVVKVVDTQTQEVIRQIPSPEFLRIAENIDSYMQAHLLHEKA